MISNYFWRDDELKYHFIYLKYNTFIVYYILQTMYIIDGIYTICNTWYMYGRPTYIIVNNYVLYLQFVSIYYMHYKWFINVIY